MKNQTEIQKQIAELDQRIKAAFPVSKFIVRVQMTGHNGNPWPQYEIVYWRHMKMKNRYLKLKEKLHAAK